MRAACSAPAGWLLRPVVQPPLLPQCALGSLGLARRAARLAAHRQVLPVHARDSPNAVACRSGLPYRAPVTGRGSGLVHRLQLQQQPHSSPARDIQLAANHSAVVSRLGPAPARSASAIPHANICSTSTIKNNRRAHRPRAPLVAAPHSWPGPRTAAVRPATPASASIGPL